MIREWIVGVRLELVAPNATPIEIMALASSVGKALAAIHTISFDRFGFFDENLNVVSPVDPGSAGLIDFVNNSLAGIGGQRLGAAAQTIKQPATFC